MAAAVASRFSVKKPDVGNGFSAVAARKVWMTSISSMFRAARHALFRYLERVKKSVLGYVDELASLA
jgi:hypothetical protein